MKYSKEIEDEMTELFYKKAVENTINDLERYFLDTNLSKKEISEYKKGMIIRERSSLVLSCEHIEFKGNVRFAIYSSHMYYNNTYSEGNDGQTFYTATNTHYIVLDVYEEKGITLITLLHLPDDHLWTAFRDRDLFDKVSYITSISIEDFKKEIENPIVKESKAHRLIGFSNGKRLDLDLKINEDKFYVEDVGFRDFRRWGSIYIESEYCNNLIRVEYDLTALEFDGLLCMIHFDFEGGIQFFPLALCSVENNRLVAKHVIRENYKCFEYTDLEPQDTFFDASDDITEGIETEDFYNIMSFITEVTHNDHVPNDAYEMLDVYELDAFRYCNHPFAVKVAFPHENGIEMYPVIVHGAYFENEDTIFYGKVKADPCKELKLKRDDIIDFELENINPGDESPFFALVCIGKHRVKAS